VAARQERGRDREARMSLAEHLIELRKRLTISAVVILLGAIGGFFLAPAVISGIRAPINEIAEQRNAQIVYTGVTESFDLRFLIAMTIGIIITSPVWLYQIFAFLVPGLTKREKKYTFGFFFSAVPLFLAGGTMGWLLFPHISLLLTSFSDTRDATLLSARPLYDFVAKLVLAVGVAFVLPVFLVLLNFIGIMSARTILKGWRIALLIIFVFCALVTPSADIVSMFLLAIPMTLLYLAAGGVAWVRDRAVARRDAALAAELA
jgi:sec-independent protein translocase protein TatC